MKYLVLCDVHGSKNWEKFKDVNKYDKLVFLGDYCDNYGETSRDDDIKNFKNIIEFKKLNIDKIVLLLGNHDLNQYILNEPVSRKDTKNYKIINRLLLDNISLFQIAMQIGDYVCSHAGFTNIWMKMNNIKTVEDANKALKNKEFKKFQWCGYDIYGEDPSQSPMWVRPGALFQDMAFDKQIVGHTKVGSAPTSIKTDDNKQEIILLETPEHDGVLELEV